MTRYILSGGFPWKARNNGQEICSKIFTHIGHDTPPENVLLCAFAQPENLWTEKLASPIAMLRQHATSDQRLSYTIASPAHFIAQLADAKYLYIAGGHTPLLRKVLDDLGLTLADWRGVLAGKTVVGSSAGVNVLTCFSINVDTTQPQEGIGLLDKASLVHYNSATYRNAEGNSIDWNHIEQLFSEGCKERNVPVTDQICIPEGEHIVLEES